MSFSSKYGSEKYVKLFQSVMRQLPLYYKGIPIHYQSLWDAEWEVTSEEQKND